MLRSEEFVEQAFFFRALRERMLDNVPMQELLPTLREETLTTTNLPMAIDFMLSELMHRGVVAGAMQQLDHYFSAFQSFVVAEAEDDHGKFDWRVGLEILEREAEYRSKEPTLPGLFMYQFETICRNRLRYDPGLLAISKDPFFSKEWEQWVLTVRRQIGIVEFADLVYVRSGQYVVDKKRRSEEVSLPESEILFGEKEGRIAKASRRKDPLILLAALQRHLSYPAVPRPKPVDDSQNVVEQLSRRIERLEARIKLVEEEQTGGIDISRFYEKG